MHMAQTNYCKCNFISDSFDVFQQAIHFRSVNETSFNAIHQNLGIIHMHEYVFKMNVNIFGNFVPP